MLPDRLPRRGEAADRVGDGTQLDVAGGGKHARQRLTVERMVLDDADRDPRGFRGFAGRGLLRGLAVHGLRFHQPSPHPLVPPATTVPAADASSVGPVGSSPSRPVDRPWIVTAP